MRENIKEDDKYYYILSSDIHEQKNKDEIKNYLLITGWKYIYNSKSKNPEVKGRRCYRLEKSFYEFLSEPYQNEGFQANENQTVNLQDDNFSLENINFDYEFKEFDERNFLLQ